MINLCESLALTCFTLALKQKRKRIIVSRVAVQNFKLKYRSQTHDNSSEVGANTKLKIFRIVSLL